MRDAWDRSKSQAYAVDCPSVQAVSPEIDEKPSLNRLD
jgi:hypothetical protein